jgi:hypothetical protein
MDVNNADEDSDMESIGSVGYTPTYDYFTDDMALGKNKRKSIRKGKHKSIRNGKHKSIRKGKYKSIRKGKRSKINTKRRKPKKIDFKIHNK